MRSELRVGRLRGTGAVMNLTTANQVIPGLSCTLDIPKGNVALVAFSGISSFASSASFFDLEVDGLIPGPRLSLYLASGSATLMASQTWLLASGKRALRMLTSASAAVGTVDPTLSVLSWIIAPQGGIA